MMNRRTGWSWMVLLFLGALLLLGAGCKGKSQEGDTVPPTPPEDKDGNDQERRAFFTPDHELYDRVEGTGALNACTSDADCVTTGCSAEVCSAERIVTTCEVRTWPQQMGAECGCVAGQCVWYR